LRTRVACASAEWWLVELYKLVEWEVFFRNFVTFLFLTAFLKHLKNHLCDFSAIFRQTLEIIFKISKNR
jgi:hypothetical protein